MSVIRWLVLSLLLWPAAAWCEDFTGDETAIILSLGPWPVEVERDASNRLSGNPVAIDFGRGLFGDVRLSADSNASCASCHLPDRQFMDGLPRGVGLKTVDRNTIALANLRQNRWYGWAGQSDNLWAQSLRPIVDARELGATPALIASRIRRHGDLSRLYSECVGTDADGHSDDLVLVNVAKALAAYQETLVTPRTAFDEFRDSLEAGETSNYPGAARRGLKLFVGKGRCAVCHTGPNFTHGEFHSIGLPHFVGDGRVDGGRFSGIQALKASPYNRIRQYSDEAEVSARRAPVNFVALNQRNWGEFRVPSLRNVANTAPYMHDGSLATLEEVVRHYSEIDMERLHTDGESLLQPLGLSDQEVADIVAFLETLSGGVE